MVFNFYRLLMHLMRINDSYIFILRNIIFFYYTSRSFDRNSTDLFETLVKHASPQ